MIKCMKLYYKQLTNKIPWIFTGTGQATIKGNDLGS